MSRWLYNLVVHISFQFLTTKVVIILTHFELYNFNAYIICLLGIMNFFLFSHWFPTHQRWTTNPARA